MGEKLAWKGKVVSVQPRIRLLRSFDQRNHNYLGSSVGNLERDQGPHDSYPVMRITLHSHMDPA